MMPWVHHGVCGRGVLIPRTSKWLLLTPETSGGSGLPSGGKGDLGSSGIHSMYVCFLH